MNNFYLKSNDEEDNGSGTEKEQENDHSDIPYIEPNADDGRGGISHPPIVEEDRR
jgi:hypothetical protein